MCMFYFKTFCANVKHTQLCTHAELGYPPDAIIYNFKMCCGKNTTLKISLNYRE